MDDQASDMYSPSGLEISGSEEEFDNISPRTTLSSLYSTSEPLNLENYLKIKQMPNYSWNQFQQIRYRETGYSGSNRSLRVAANLIGFQNGYYGSRHTIEKMQLMYSLKRHENCVNSLHFNRKGNLIVTGSDDLKIIIFNWSAMKALHVLESGHSSTIFETRFSELPGVLNIISCGRDGQVRHSVIPPSGLLTYSSRSLFKHAGSAFKIAQCNRKPYEILSVGADGCVMHCDLRNRPTTQIVKVRNNKRVVSLYGLDHHPYKEEFCVCGHDNYVRVYDHRYPKIPAYLMCPEHLKNVTVINDISSVIYNSTGTEILASYINDDIYLFNNRSYISGQFIHRYTGRKNDKSIKTANFFGQNSEYVISGNDYGNLFIWDKNNGTIVNWVKGDDTGPITCIEGHPFCPILATAGFDNNIKIWMPASAKYPPSMKGLAECIENNPTPSATDSSSISDHDIILVQLIEDNE